VAKQTTIEKSKLNSRDTVLTTAAAGSTVYQMKVHLIDISPMIWRRFQVSGDSTLSDFHYILQLVMGWSNTHLNQFIIHGKRYGVYHDGGMTFSDDPATVRLIDLQLREREKFRYDYNFIDNWMHQLRVEKILYPEQPLAVPICTAGKRSVPPENCGGPWAFQQKKQDYGLCYAYEVIADILDGGLETLEARREEALLLQKYLSIEEFDRQTVNRRLQQYAEGDRKWLFAEVLG
jgi:hypothetical protein